MQNLKEYIIFEDDSLLAINKPAGITVNKSETTKGDTVQDWAEVYIPMLAEKHASAGNEILDPSDPYDTVAAFYSRGGVVHRLDKETSGVLLLAKNPDSFGALQSEFKERIVKKTYIALAHGKVFPEEGEIVAPVGRLPWNRKQFGIVAGGRDSKTLYKTLSHFQIKKEHGQGEILSLLELHPETGRTHQIRVHLKHIGYPIYADFLYAGRKTSRDDRKGLERVFLHARELQLVHPFTKQQITFTAPLPKDLEVFLESLERVE
jgi:23S rRNA pseudouridine1911/1915/1917 synthase